MKFAAKYEILEPVARGAVETFVARSIATDERVLVHIFECPEQRPDQPTVQWVLESFRAIAPEPAELVLATGRYSGTTYAYLATKLPDNAALKAWVQSYESREETEEKITPPERALVPDLAQEAGEQPLPSAVGAEESTVIREIKQPKETTVIEALRVDSAAPPETSEASDAGQAAAAAMSDTIIDFGGTDFRPVEKLPQPEPGEAPGRLSGSGSAPKGPAQAVPFEVPRQKEPPQSGDPIDEILGLVGEPRPRVGGALPRETPGIAAQESTPDLARPAEPGGITDLFGLNHPAPPPNSVETASSIQDDGNTGEFTRFFRGPFHGERPSQTPPVSTTSPPPRKQAGEFTEIFGKGGGSVVHGASTQESLVRDNPVERDSAPVVHRFQSSEPEPKIQETYELSPQQTEILERNSQKFPAFIEPAPSSVPAPPEPPLDSGTEPPVPQFGGRKSWSDADEAFALRSQADATRVFSAPEKEWVEDSSPSQTGPSDFTRIISGGLIEPNPVEEPVMPGGSGDDFVERLGAPPVRPAPAAPSPPRLQRPGQFPQTPAPPAVATPPASAASRLGSVSPKQAGVPWTLIIIINALVILAVVLVLYFALKH